jgi:hypothetical protein
LGQARAGMSEWSAISLAANPLTSMMLAVVDLHDARRRLAQGGSSPSRIRRSRTPRGDPLASLSSLSSVSRDHTRCGTALHRVCCRIILYGIKAPAAPEQQAVVSGRNHDTARGPGGPCSVAPGRDGRDQKAEAHRCAEQSNAAVSQGLRVIPSTNGANTPGQYGGSRNPPISHQRHLTRRGRAYARRLMRAGTNRCCRQYGPRPGREHRAITGLGPEPCGGSRVQGARWSCSSA